MTDPNRKPFPRAFFLEPFVGQHGVHPLLREAQRAYFKRVNPQGFHHDLGAQDVFLDNYGMLFEDQFTPSQWAEYRHAVEWLLERWGYIGWLVEEYRPYWGEHLNSRHRRARGGEPRSLIRLFGDGDWSRLRYGDLPLGEQLELGGEEADAISGEAVLDDFRALDILPCSRTEPDLAPRWEGDSLISGRFLADDSTHWRHSEHAFDGVPLPEGLPLEVDELRILHPRHCTPDLPPRVGTSPDEQARLATLVRDQGRLGTCTSHAISVALDVLVRRKEPDTCLRFSPAWIHCRSGVAGDQGRSLSDAMGALCRELPCSEDAHPYDPARLAWWHASQGAWETDAMRESSRANTQRYGRLEAQRLDVQDVSAIKTRLAAGWLVVLSTSVTEEMRGHSLMEYGLALCPLRGQRRIGGHAWLLVGYDHTDGNQQWKYQGRFHAINSWGANFPTRPAHAKGLCSLPFATVLTEGLEAFALRLSRGASA